MFRFDLSEVTILGKSCAIDKSKAVSLGFTSAGWQVQKQLLLELMPTVYTSGITIIEPELSIYKRCHDASVQKHKSFNKTVDFKSVQKALEVVEGLLNRLTSESLINLFDQFLSCYKLQEQTHVQYLAELDAAFKQYSDMGSGTVLLQAGVAHFVDAPVHTVEDEEIEFHGYQFVRYLTAMKTLDTHLTAEDKKLAKEILEWSSYVNLAHTGEEIQAVITNAKATIVDWLQETLRFIIAGKPLTPLYFVVEQTGDKPFNPNWDMVTKKARHSYTASELRMIYRLGKEVSDELIKDIISNLVIFCSYHPKEGFVKINAPWQQNPDRWINRKRSNDRLPFFQRDEALNPRWLHELSLLSKRAKSMLEASPPTAVPSSNSSK